MVYNVTSDSATKISESSGTIQNHSRDWDVEISNSADFTDKILLYPRQNYSFSNMDVYLRCAEQGRFAEVFVVPFKVEKEGGGNTIIYSSTDTSIAFTDTATTSTAGLMSAVDKTKLDGIETAAQVNVIETVKVNGTPLVPDANKAVNITGAGGGGGLQPVIQVTCESSDVTVTKSGVNYPATSHNGNIHIFPVDDYGTYIVTATATVFGVTVTRTTTVDVIDYNALKIFTANIPFRSRFGYRIRKNEADPYERVEYLYDAVGMTPAHMDFESGVFNYGDWDNVWFVADNKPCMLKSDGTVDYYLNPNDYTLKENGELSDVANIDYDGNAMAQFPLCWVYRYEDDNYLYEIVSNVQYDENYKAYAHTDASGNIKPYFYSGLFVSSGDTSKLRSLYNKSVAYNSYNAFMPAAKANGNNWYLLSWAQFQLIRTLITLIGKSTDSQAQFGNGSGTGTGLTAGSLYDKGQFFGFNSDYSHQVKCFHVESLWADMVIILAGIFRNSDNYIYVKMTPENGGYPSTASVSGFTKTSFIYATNIRNYAKGYSCNQYGMFPSATGASSSTYFCDHYVVSVTNALILVMVGGSTLDRETVVYGLYNFVTDSYFTPTRSREDMGYIIAYV